MVRIVYVADFSDVGDYFDAAYLLMSDKHAVSIVAPLAAHDALRNLISISGYDTHCLYSDITDLVDSSANWIITSDYDVIDPLMNADKQLRRKVIERLFVVGGHANDYSLADEPLRIDPRLKEREPQRFLASGDRRVSNVQALTGLLLSREAVVWLPRDICLWRYAAPQIFELAPNPVNQWLLNGLSEQRGEGMPVLLSSFPAFCLSVSPDTMPWLRLFHTVLGRIECSPITGRPTPILTQTHANAHIVTAIDGFACGKFVTNVLRGAAQ